MGDIECADWDGKCCLKQVHRRWPYSTRREKATRLRGELIAQKGSMILVNCGNDIFEFRIMRNLPLNLLHRLSDTISVEVSDCELRIIGIRTSQCRCGIRKKDLAALNDLIRQRMTG